MDEGELPERRFGWSDMFVAEDDDPRVDGGWGDDERSVLLGQLRDRRLTLEMKCSGLDAEQLTRPSVPPSDLSLIGLVRHLAGVETYWASVAFAGEDVARPFVDEFGVEPSDAEIAASWTAWREAVGCTERVVAETDDLGQLGAGRAVPLREILVHLIREYAQHLGHADLLRERIDGRVGQ